MFFERMIPVTNAYGTLDSFMDVGQDECYCDCYQMRHPRKMFLGRYQPPSMNRFFIDGVQWIPSNNILSMTCPYDEESSGDSDSGDSDTDDGQKTSEMCNTSRSENFKKTEIKLDLSDFRPEDIQVKMRDGKCIEVHARREERTGKSHSYRQTQRVIPIPENVDPKLLKPTLNSEGILVLEEVPLSKAIDNEKQGDVEKGDMLEQHMDASDSKSTNAEHHGDIVIGKPNKIKELKNSQEDEMMISETVDALSINDTDENETDGIDCKKDVSGVAEVNSKIPSKETIQGDLRTTSNIAPPSYDTIRESDQASMSLKSIDNDSIEIAEPEDATNASYKSDNNDENQMKIEVNVSDFKPEEITVKTKDGKSVEICAKCEQKSENSYSFKEFRRVFVIPANVDPKMLKSELSPEGVLIIKAPIHAAIDVPSHSQQLAITHED